MRVIHIKTRNVVYLIALILSGFGAYKFYLYVQTTRWYDHWFGDENVGLCTKHLRWTTHQDALPLIALLGAPGSGIEWARHLIEQMTGIYTGSTNEDYPEYFAGEGKTSEVIAVMAYDAEKLSKFHAGLVIYRHMNDTVRTSYAQNIAPDIELEAPLESYYGSEWPRYAKYEGNTWVERYSQYIQSKRPLMIVNYDQLADPNQMKNELLRISNFFHVPVLHSKINCLVKRGHDFDLKPRALRHGFNPFSVLSVEDGKKLNRMANLTEILIGKARQRYSPKLH